MALPDQIEADWDDFRRSLARRGRSASTLSIYRKSYDNFWDWALAEGVQLDPAAVDHTIINRWTDYLLTAPALRNGRPIMKPDPATGEQVEQPLEASTRRIRFVNLRPFFSWWAKEYERPNPFDRADPPSEPAAPPIPVVNDDDLSALLRACAGKGFTERRDLALVSILIDTGARLGELLAMTLDDWNPRGDLVRLRGKTGVRDVTISPATGEDISRYLRIRKDHPKARLGAFWLAPRGALTESGVAQILRRRCDQAGIEHIHPHQLRHTFAHQFRAEGGSEGDLMYLAGWKSTAMAHRYGRSAAAERAQESLRRLNLRGRL
jgi:integrase